MKVTLGNLKLLHSQSVIVPEDEDLWLEFRVYDWDMKLKVKFVNDKEDSDRPSSADLQGMDDYALLTLKNMNNSLGSALSRPLELGTSNNRPIYALLANHAIGNMMKFEIQVYVENTNE